MPKAAAAAVHDVDVVDAVDVAVVVAVDGTADSDDDDVAGGPRCFLCAPPASSSGHYLNYFGSCSH